VIDGIEPAIADDGEQDARLIQRFVNPATEIVAIANRVDVKKEPVAPEPALEMVEYSACDVGRVLAAVREKDPGHGAAGQRRSPGWNIKEHLSDMDSEMLGRDDGRGGFTAHQPKGRFSGNRQAEV
jgi:hypothetical protein